MDVGWEGGGECKCVPVLFGQYLEGTLGWRLSTLLLLQTLHESRTPTREIVPLQ